MHDLLKTWLFMPLDDAGKELREYSMFDRQQMAEKAKRFAAWIEQLNNSDMEK